MALEDLQSQYGPTNKKGQRGTGVGVDTLAGEGQGNLGHAANKSKYGTSEKIGTPPTGPDPLGNIPAERSFE